MRQSGHRDQAGEASSTRIDLLTPFIACFHGNYEPVSRSVRIHDQSFPLKDVGVSGHQSGLFCPTLLEARSLRS